MVLILLETCWLVAHKRSCDCWVRQLLCEISLTNRTRLLVDGRIAAEVHPLLR